jgi:hypothetical protein
MVVRISFPLDRYLINQAPAVAIGVGLLPSLLQHKPGRWVGIAAVLTAAGYAIHLFFMPIPYCQGYEPIARHLIAHPEGASVAIHAAQPGNLIFHLRRLDPESQLYVLPSDKYLSYESPDEVVRPLVSSSDEIAGLLDRYGVRYLLVEDREKNLKRRLVHHMLTEAVSNPDTFEELGRFPIEDRVNGNSELILYRLNGDGKIKVDHFELRMGRMTDAWVRVPVAPSIVPGAAFRE